MKNVFSLIFLSLLIIGSNSNFLRLLQSSTNTYDYSSYSSISKDTNLSGQTLTSSTSDQNVVYITKQGITIENSNLQKTGGDSSNTENSEFYGINVTVLI